MSGPSTPSSRNAQGQFSSRSTTINKTTPAKKKFIYFEAIVDTLCKVIIRLTTFCKRLILYMQLKDPRGSNGQAIKDFIMSCWPDLNFLASHFNDELIKHSQDPNGELVRNGPYFKIRKGSL